jgi:hypothetical protein
MAHFRNLALQARTHRHDRVAIGNAGLSPTATAPRERPIPATDAVTSPRAAHFVLRPPAMPSVRLGAVLAALLLPASARADEAAESSPAREPTGFTFGSYGRIAAGTDLRGGTPEPVAVVAHGARIVEPTYLELDLAYGFVAPSGHRLRTVTTIAFADSLFHSTGDFDATIALRNLFLEAELGGGISAWAGSRMYRGDDIYLLDYWPLDDLNTVGAGARYRAGGLDLAAHAGVNRLLDDFQFQEDEVPDPEQGATTVVQLDRQRFLASASASVEQLLVPALDLHGKVKLHAELHAVPDGERRRGDDTLETLPRDWGTTVGVQAGVWTPAQRGHRRHANLFARWSKGLAAFDELAPPSATDDDLETFPGASELVLGLAGGWDHPLGNALVGGYARRFVDGDRNGADRDDGWEYIAAVRPLARAIGDLYAGADLSYQVRFPRGVNPTSQLASDPAIVQLAPMLVYSPMGPSAYDRPQLRLVYRAARLNQGARDLYVPDDPRHAETWVHFLGVQAEWWFNSTYR